MVVEVWLRIGSVEYGQKSRPAKVLYLAIRVTGVRRKRIALNDPYQACYYAARSHCQPCLLGSQ